MLLPISDDNSQRRTFPTVNYILIAINLIVFYYELTAGDSFIYGYSVIPAEITTGQDLIGVIHGIPQAPGPAPIYLTLFTSMFMHSGWAHLLGNMLYLWIFGDNVEDAMGHFRYIIFYLLCGLAADFAQIASDPYSLLPSLGASGAIAGVLGGYLVMYPRNPVRVFVWIFLTTMPAVIVIGFWFLLQLLDSYGSLVAQTTHNGGVAYFAHIGGFIAGVVLIFIFRKPRAYVWPA